MKRNKMAIHPDYGATMMGMFIYYHSVFLASCSGFPVFVLH